MEMIEVAIKSIIIGALVGIGVGAGALECFMHRKRKEWGHFGH